MKELGVSQEKVAEALDYLLGKRQYAIGRVEPGRLVIDKKWNRGLGRLEVMEINWAQGYVLKNSFLFTRWDEMHLGAVLGILGLAGKKLRVETRWYGYPVFYEKSFSLSLPK